VSVRGSTAASLDLNHLELGDMEVFAPLICVVDKLRAFFWRNVCRG
jgi:hypothetical protein